MIDLSNIEIQNIVIHKVGNKLKDEGMVISNEVCDIDGDDLKAALLKYFLSAFKFDTFYRFHHEADLQLNEVYTYANTIFKDNTAFYEQSVHLLKHLYEQQAHPQIKPGEFYVVHFNNMIYDNFEVDAIGLFKSENKDMYLKVEETADSALDVRCDEGINIRKLDKGCLILNYNAAGGFAVGIVDPLNKGNEAAYWKDDFLKIEILKDESFMTDAYVRMCADFYDDVIVPATDQFEKKDKLMFLNQTVQYFAQNEQFEEESFAEEVIRDPEYINIFKTYKESYEEMNELPAVTEFPISHTVLKRVKREFKNDIKLDTDIEIKLKSESFDYLERGYDEERNMYYYKVFFNNEA